MRAQGITGGNFLFENPTTALVMGLCPAVAVSARLIDALWMSACVLAVLVLASLAMALVARFRASEGGVAPGEGSGAHRLGALLVSSALTGSIEILLAAYAPGAAASLGIYAPLVAVNCLVLGGTEKAFATASPGLADAVRNGFAFAACLIVLAIVREVLGAGTITVFPLGSFGGTLAVPGISRDPVRAVGLAGGGLISLGYLAAVVRAARIRRDGRVGGKAGAT